VNGDITDMKDENKTKKQLLDELAILRQRITDLESLEKNHDRSKKALMESEDRYRNLFEGAGDSIFIMHEYQFIECNRMTLEMYGCKKKEDIIGYYPWDFSPKHQSDGRPSKTKAIELMDAALAGNVQRFYWMHLRKDGTPFDAEVSLSPLEIVHEKYIQAIVRDITERKNIEKALIKSELFNRRLVESAPLGIMYLNSEGVITYENPSLLRMTGVPENVTSPALGKKLAELPSIKEAGVLSDLSRVLAGESITGKVVHYQSLFRVELDLEVEAAPIVDEKGNVEGVILMTNNITDRKRAAEALRLSEERFRELAELLPLIVFETNLEGNLTYSNLAAFKAFQYSQEDFEKGQNCLDMVIPADRVRASTNIKKILKGEELGATEYQALRKDGSTFPVLIYSSPIVRDDIIVGLRGVIVDITSRKEAENAIARSETFYRQVIENAAGVPFRLIFGSTVGRGHYDFVGDGIKSLLGVPPDEFTESTFYELLEEVRVLIPDIPTDPEAGRQAFIRGKIPQYKADVRIRTRDNEEKWVNDSSIPLRDEETGDIIGSFGILQDITDRKLTEEALRDSQEWFKILFDFAPDAYYLNDLKGNFIDGNRAAEKLMGYKREELIGKSFLKLKIMPANQTAKAAKILAKNALGQATGPDVLTLNRKDKSQVTVEIRAYPLKFKNQTMVLGIARDITERQQTENRLKASLKEKEILLKEIHHRVKNNLQVICSLLNLQSRQVENEPSFAMFEETRNRVRSMALVHEELYRSSDFSHVDFAGYVKNLIASLYRAYNMKGENIKLNVDVAEISLGVDTAVPCGLIINELFSNALKHAFPPTWEGKAKIDVIIKESDDGDIVLTVRDNGIGIPKDLDIGQTQSLGLHLVRILAEDQLEGSIHIDRTNGTAFRIAFKPS